MASSKILKQLEVLKEEVELKNLMSPTPPFATAETTKQAVEKRKKQSSDFFVFEDIYFPKQMYSEGYYPNAEFHKEIVNIFNQSEFHLILSGRGFGKTVTAKKVLIHKLLHNDNFNFIGILSENLVQARRIMASIGLLIHDNPRIMSDYKPQFQEFNGDNIVFRLPKSNKIKCLIPLSEGRSARGSSMGFDRLDAVFGDDFITNTSSLTDDGKFKQRATLNETYGSIKRDGGLYLCGNNFDVKCLYNEYVIEKKDGVLPPFIHLHIYPAWDSKSLWYERYPANSEAELKSMIKPADDMDWNGNYQQDPQPARGFIYHALPQFYAELPRDAAGIIYCDPNLSLKEKGDSTAVLVLMFSGTTQKFYMVDCRCKSYSDSNQLLDDITELRKKHGANKLHVLGFDGNVSQESTWTDHVRKWQRKNNLPYARIEYKRYRTDEFIKSYSPLWNNGDVLCSEHFRTNEEGKEFIQQMYRFKGKAKKQSGVKIDGGDCFTCSMQLLHEGRYHKRSPEGAKPRNYAITGNYF